MYVKTVVRKRGDKEYRYRTLAESEKVEDMTRHNTLFRLSEASVLTSTGEIERIVSSLSKHLETPMVRIDDLGSNGALNF